MAGGISAADGALDHGASIVADSRAELTRHLRALEGDLAGLGARWRGRGASAFATLMARWNQDAASIVDALDTFEQNLTASQSTYTSTDESSSSAFHTLASRLG